MNEPEQLNSLRDHFAGLAMQADLNASANAYYQKGTNLDVESIAEFSYKLADAMLKAREAKSEN